MDAPRAGQRLQCERCGREVVVIRSGDGELVCHGETMTVETPKPLPSSD